MWGPMTNRSLCSGPWSETDQTRTGSSVGGWLETAIRVGGGYLEQRATGRPSEACRPVTATPRCRVAVSDASGPVSEMDRVSVDGEARDGQAVVGEAAHETALWV
jgi:hypothetical protein